LLLFRPKIDLRHILERNVIHAFFVLFLAGKLAFSSVELPLRGYATVLNQTNEVTSTKFDPHRNSFDDLSAATEEAKRTKRNILIEVGGEWCEWCHIMDEFYAKNPKLLTLRDKYYVTVKADVSENHSNAKFLSQFPQIDGAPHIFILDASGKLVRSEDTSELEDGQSYNVERFKKFLEKYAPKN
jgi:thiol:disulfide interchange protein